MPAARALLQLAREYTAQEFKSIIEGLVPQQMEDKWFIYYEEPWLYLHRSWTGFCIYIVRFEKSIAGYAIREAWAIVT